MKITDLEVIPLSVPLRHETPESPWAVGLGRQLIVRVHTDAGITGLGEAFAYGVPLAVCAVIEALKPLLIGADPTQPDVLFDHLSQAALFYGRRGLGLFALSGSLEGAYRRRPRRAAAPGGETALANLS